MTTQHLSQTALYGDILTIEQAYSQDVGDVPRLTFQEEETLIDQARAGDVEARDAVIRSLLTYVIHVAQKYATICRESGRPRVEYLDLVQVGNLTLLECLEKALAHACPVGYLKRASSGEIVKHCMKHGSLITSPSKRGGDILPIKDVDSIDMPVRTSGDTPERLTLAETLIAPEKQEKQERDYTALHEALDILTEKQKYIIVRHYGIECAPEDLFTLSCALREAAGKPFKDSANEAYSAHRGAITKLEKHLAGASMSA